MKKPVSLQVLKKKLEQYYQSMHTEMERADAAYYRRYNELLVNLPQDVPIHESSTASLIVDGLRDQINIDNPKIEYFNQGSSAKGRDEKAAMELFGGHVMREIPLHTSIHPFRQALSDFLLRGVGCIKYLVDMETQPDPPKTSTPAKLRRWNAQRSMLWPFVVYALDPLTVYPAPGPRQPPLYMLEVQTRLAADVLEQYPAWTDPNQASVKGRRSGPETRTTEWLEFWSAEHYIIEADGERIIDEGNPNETNPYGFVPYVWEFSGFGRQSADADPAKMAYNILSPIIGELEDEVRIKTAQSAQWQFHVFPRLLTTDDAKKVRRQFMQGPGAIIHYDPGHEKPEWLNTPPPSPEMSRFLDEVSRNIFRRFGSALQERPAGVDAGIHQALLIGQALKTVQPVKASLDRLGSRLLNGLARQMAVMDLRLNVSGREGKLDVERTIQGHTISPDAFRVSFEATDPAENDRRMLAGLAVLRGLGPGQKTMSNRTFREKYLKGVVESNDEEEAMILSELVISRLIEQGVLDQLVLQTVAEEDQSEGQAKAMAGVNTQIRDALAQSAQQLRAVEGAARVAPGTAVDEEAQMGEASALGGLV